ncbi:hypothetical protein PF010_g29260 [Phytophthora fragariae]|uniref:Uncharacterized protein n=1 Tax=Phytophthora fragariae TaxID=53985 RepID=A0A6G0JP70_9STRA|nr:hypothetical protein PF010_g29260 [Phytophthora fragariae]
MGSGSKQRSVKYRDRPVRERSLHRKLRVATTKTERLSPIQELQVASAESTSSQPGHEASPGSSPPAPTATAAQQQRAAHARSVKAQKLLRRREVLELRQRQAAHARLLKRPKQATQPDN